MAQLSPQQDWFHMFQIFHFNVANTRSVRVTRQLCYFVNKLTCNWSCTPSEKFQTPLVRTTDALM